MKVRIKVRGPIASRDKIQCKESGDQDQDPTYEKGKRAESNELQAGSKCGMTAAASIATVLNVGGGGKDQQ